MNIQEWLRNYRKNSSKISMAEAVGKVNSEIAKLISEKIILDKAISMLENEQLMAIEGHFKKGESYEKIGRNCGYSKVSIYNRCRAGINMLEKVLE